MQPRFWSFRTFAALWSILLAPIVPLASAEDDPATLVPQDTLVYVGWSQLAREDSRLWQLIDATVHAPLLDRVAGDEIAPVRQHFGFIRELLSYRGAFALLGPLDGDGEEAPPLGVVIDAGDRASALAEALGAIVAQHADDPAAERSVAGVAMQSVAIEDGNLLWAAHGDRLVVAIGETAAERLIQRLNGAGASLAEHAEYTLARSKVEPAEGWHLSLYAGFRDLIEMGLAAETSGAEESERARELLRAFGLDQFGGYYLRLDEIDYGTRMSVFMRTGGGTGLGKLWHQTPLTDDDIAVVPADAHWASVANLDLHATWREFRNGLEEVDPNIVQQVDGGLAMARGMLGFSPTDDLLAAFGDTWAFYDSPGHGGLLFTGITAVADARDAEGLDAMLQRLVELGAPFAAQVDARVRVEQMQRDGYTVKYVLAGGWPVPIAPAWGFVDGRCVLGLFPQTVLVAMKQADPDARSGSLLDHADYKRARPLLPEQLTSLEYTDARSSAGAAYGLAHLAQTAVASMSADSARRFDIESIRLFPETRGEVRNMIGGYGRDGEGIVYRSVGVSTAAFLPTSAVSVATIALLVSILLPSLTRARELAKRAVSASNLRGIAQGCHMYAQEEDGAFPSDLRTLIERGFITSGMLVSPRDDLEESDVVAGDPGSYVYVAGQSTSSDVRNVIAYERLHESDDGGFFDTDEVEGTNVLFVDGHVEWMKPDAFRQALRETYQRLNRMDEFPEIWRD